jgi:capsular polysaccharide biosynthesis protein
MELRELGDRLFRLHAKLIIGLMLLGVLAALAINLQVHRQYQASALLVIGAPDPQSVAEATALANTASGIATGPQMINRAIAQARASRSELAVASAVSVQAIGSSGVLNLTVTDPDPHVAVRLANALAAGVVQTRIALAQSDLAPALQNLTQQETQIAVQIQHLNSEITALTARSATLRPGVARTATARRLRSLQASRSALEGQAAQLAVQRNDLAVQQGPRATVIDKAITAVSSPGRSLLDVLLGAVLGLVLGIACAAGWEALQPRLVGAVAISRATGVPLLGEMTTPPDSWTLASLPDAGTYVELAADSQQVHEVRFAVLDPGGRHGARVRMLAGPLRQLRLGSGRGTNLLVATTHDGHPAESAAAADPLAPAASLDGSPPPRIGLVAAIPRVLKLADVDALTNFIWISGWTLLGVIVFTPSKKTATTVTDRQHPADGATQGSQGGQVEVDA